MPKHKKTTKKQSFFSAFLQSSGVTAAAVVLLCVSLGAVIIPGIFAATTLVVTNLKAVPTNTANYGVTITWNGTTQNGYRVELYTGGSTMTMGVNVTSGTFSPSGLTCGTTYTVKVYPRRSDGAVAPNYAMTSVVPTCPVASWVSLSGSSNTLYATWNDTYGFSQSYSLTASAPGGAYSSTTTSSKSATLSASCGMTYTVTLRATANGQSGTAVNKTTSTAACPPASSGGGTTTPSGGNTGGSTSGGGGSTPSSGTSSGGGTTTTPSGSSTPTTKTKTSTSSSGTKKVTTVAPVSAAPSTPENFSADVVSSKIVALTWDTSTNADHYVLKRSLDQTTWQDLTTVTTTFYNDVSADFSKTYYYQLQAVGGDGKTSGVVTAQATTEAFAGSSDTITSADKLVQVTIPEGAIDGEYNCTLQTSDDGLDPSALSADQSALLGPFDLMCVSADGTVVEEYGKPLKITMNLSSVANGYDNITVRMYGEDGWPVVKSSYDAKKKVISFEMTGSQLFAAFGVKHKSPVGTIISVFFILLLAGAAIAAALWWRRRAPAHMPSSYPTGKTAEQEFNEALAKPNCTHLGMAQQVMPSGQGCFECEAVHTNWNALRICLICGHVGCSDDSPQQHAHKHFLETGHPIVYAYADPNGNSVGWCYIDQTYI